MAGYSAYTRFLDYARFRKAADSVGAYLMADMAHIGGLVAAGLAPDPFEHCDIVTTTIHKTLRGPRAALLFYRKSTPLNPNLGEQMSSSVFPGHLGGPHNHTISAVATCLLQAASPEFKEYQTQVLKNSKIMGERLASLGYSLATGGTENHMLLVGLKDLGVDGSVAEIVLEKADIIINKNTLKGDVSAMRPSGMRVGSPSMTTRGCDESAFVQISDLLHEGVLIAKDVMLEGEKLPAFKKRLNKVIKEGDGAGIPALKKKVNEFSNALPFNFTPQMI